MEQSTPSRYCSCTPLVEFIQQRRATMQIIFCETVYSPHVLNTRLISAGICGAVQSFAAKEHLGL